MEEIFAESRQAINSDDKLVEERKEQIFSFLKKKANWIYYLILAGIVYLAVFIRTRNMQINPATGNPGLWDITTNNWTLGPDLDPFLFLRWAEYIVEHGKLMAVDTMRYVPLGYDTAGELPVIPYLIAYVHKFLLLLGINQGIEYSAILTPVIMFALTVIAFFFLVREVFWNEFKDKNIVNIIALISCFFLSVLPSILPRTIAGIPEKESAAFLFMFLAFLFFIKAWNSKSNKKISIFIILSALSTALMNLTWGGSGYIYLVIGATVFVSFLIGNVGFKKWVAYGGWLILSFLVSMPFSSRFGSKSILTSTVTGGAIAVFFIIAVSLFIERKNIRGYFKKFEAKIPLQLISLIISIIILLIGIVIFFGPSFIVNELNGLFANLVKPASSRLIQTVAENRQPSFNEWAGNFGPTLGKMPVFFCLFITGSIVLFYNLLKKLNKSDRIKMTTAYIIFLICIIFSRYSETSMMNGENVISLIVYFGGFLIFVIYSVKVYIEMYKEDGLDKLKLIGFGPLLIISFFILGIISARGAVRLIMMLVPPTSAIVGYLIGFGIYKTSNMQKIKDDGFKLFGFLIIIIIVVASVYSGIYFYKVSKSQADVFYPSQYQWQWQKAMAWVRENTPENAVFGHWWDYGYWLQSIGKRATVLDGGNAQGNWNRMMGRYVLTSPDDKVSLEYLYAHNTTHFLIDSTEIGKYSAYSFIGSNKELDRQSFIPNFALNEKMTKETKNGTIFYYSSGIPLDEDIIWEEEGNKIFFAKENSGIGAIIVEETSDGKIKQPRAVFVSQAGLQKEIPIRYLYYNGGLYDFNSGLEAGIFLCDYIVQDSDSFKAVQRGGGLYLSERTVNSFLARKYLFGEEGSFKLVHTESNYIIGILKQQGFYVGEFAYFQGQLLGPIKIWEIEYPKDIEYKEEYIETAYPEELL